MSNRTILVGVSTMSPSIDQIIALVVVVPQTLLKTSTKEVVVNAAPGDAWVREIYRDLSGVSLMETPQAKFVMLLVSKMLPPRS